MLARVRVILVATITVALIAGCGGTEFTPEPSQPTTDEPDALQPSVTAVPTVLATSAPGPPEPEPTPTAEPEVQARITIIYNNIPQDPRLITQWGFAALVEYRDQVILFDTGGEGRILEANMEVLQIDPAEIDAVVLSHEHGDHTGGLTALASAGVQPPVYGLPSFPADLKAAIADQTEFIEVEPGMQVLEGIYTTGELGGSIPEQALVIETDSGAIVITGCAHPGVVQLVAKAVELFGGPVRLVTGGFHMAEQTQSQIETVLADLRQLEVQKASPSHCTGDLAIAMFAAEFGADFMQGGLGQVFIVTADDIWTATADLEGAGFMLQGLGLRTPESVLHDPEADLYLVSNINGNPSARDGNGFISQISPEGAVLALKWIDGTESDVVLNAPKGMALAGGRLYVTDIDVVRMFDQITGVPLGKVEVPGAVFLNDADSTPDGVVYVTDMTGNAIYRIKADGIVELVAQGESLGKPNGIVVSQEGILVAGSATGEVYRLGQDGLPELVAQLPSTGLDGLILMDDGAMLVSSWSASAVFQVESSGEINTLVEGVMGPADIGYDAERGYLLIPLFQSDRLQAWPMPGAN